MSNIKLSPQAQQFLQELPSDRRAYLIDVIRQKSLHTSDQMPVLSWCFDDTWPFIERAIKDYRYAPGIRILFHVVRNPDGIKIDPIAWRCDNPYGDGH